MVNIKKLFLKILNVISGLADYMEATTSSNQTISSSDTVTIVNLSTPISNGTKLSFNSSTHKITVGAGVKYVEVSGQVYISTNGTAGSKNAYIYLGDTAVARTIMNLSSNYNILTIAPRIIPVSQNDEITLRVQFNGTTTVVTTGISQTRLTVKVLG